MNYVVILAGGIGKSQGQVIGYLKPQWYHFAKEYSKKALPLYNE